MAGVIFLVLAILVVVGACVAVFVTWLLRRGRKVRADLAAELATEPAVRGPESAVYRGSTGGYSQVLGNGVLALTAHRLLFRKSTGGHVDVPRADITGVQLQKVFNRSVVGKQLHLVVHTHRGAVGFFVSDPDAWVAELAAPAG